MSTHSVSCATQASERVVLQHQVSRKSVVFDSSHTRIMNLSYLLTRNRGGYERRDQHGYNECDGRRKLHGFIWDSKVKEILKMQ